MEKIKISIPSPCDYGWDNMTLVEGEAGRHCASCNKIVKDFSILSTEEIMAFFSDYKNEKPCGHFKQYQLSDEYKGWQLSLLNAHRRVNMNYKPGLAKTMVLGLIVGMVYLSGCNGGLLTTEGELMVPCTDTTSCGFGDTIDSTSVGYDHVVAPKE